MVDAGAAEGIFTLDCVDLADKVYLIKAGPRMGGGAGGRVQAWNCVWL